MKTSLPPPSNRTATAKTSPEPLWKPAPLPPPRPAPKTVTMTTGQWVLFLFLVAALGVVSGLYMAERTRNAAVAAAPAPAPTEAELKLKMIASTKRSERAVADGIAWPTGVMTVEDLLAIAAFADGPYRKGELIVGAQTPQELDAMATRAEAVGGTVIGTIPGVNQMLLKFPDALSAATFLDGSPGETAIQGQLDYTVSLPAPPAADDPSAPGSMQPFGDRAMAYLGVPTDNSNWGKGVMIAMLDTGLSAGDTNLLTGTGIINQMDLTGSPDAALPGHADMVASLLSGAQGEQGMVPSASLMSVRVLDSDNSGDVFTVADGIYTAVAAGAKVLNLSLGTDQPSDVLLQAVNYAISQGAVVIAAAGNNGTGQILYPAAYPGVIAVGAIDATGERATFSDYGPELSVAAPGVGLNTVSAAGQEQFSGTSAAAPLVAGAVAALMASDSSVTAQQAVDLLSKYADFAGPLPTQSDGLVVTQTDSTGETIYSNEFYGAGVIDMERLMNRNNSNYSDAALADMYMNLDGVGLGSAQVPMQVSVQNRGNELLTDLNVTVTINSQSTTHFLSALGPGQVSAITVEVPMNELLSGSGVSLTSSVSDFAPLYPDARPDNNTLSRQVKLVPTTTSGVDTGGVTAGP